MGPCKIDEAPRYGVTVAI